MNQNELNPDLRRAVAGQLIQDRLAEEQKHESHRQQVLDSVAPISVLGDELSLLQAQIHGRKGELIPEEIPGLVRDYLNATVSYYEARAEIQLGNEDDAEAVRWRDHFKIFAEDEDNGLVRFCEDKIDGYMSFGGSGGRELATHWQFVKSQLHLR